MKRTLVDPNRSDRWTYFGMGGFVCALSLVLPFTNPTFPWVGLAALFGGLFIIGIGVLTRPYVVLDRSGVTYRFLLRKKFYRWDEVARVGIRNTKATKVPVEYLFALVIVFPGSPRYPLLWETFHSVLVPGHPEIRKFVEECYGPLDFNDINGLNDWQKRYFRFE